MKLCRSPPNNSDGIFSVSFSVQPPFKLRSSSVRAPFNLRSGIGERTKNKGKCNDNTSVLKRRDSEAQKGTNNTEV